MVHECLRPGMQNQDKTDPAFKVPLWVFSKRQQSSAHGAEQHVEGGFFIAADDGVKLMRQGKDEVKISAGKQFCFPVIEPALFYQSLAFGTVPVPA
jgi:hypothetical protein